MIYAVFFMAGALSGAVMLTAACLLHKPHCSDGRRRESSVHTVIYPDTEAQAHEMPMGYQFRNLMEYDGKEQEVNENQTASE